MNRNSSSGPSLKKKLVCLIRNFSQPGCTSDQNIDKTKLNARPDTFIHKYLQGESRVVQPAIIYGRSVEELPPRPLGRLKHRSFAAFTGPGGGLTSVNRNNPSLEICEPDVDFIDSEDALPDDQPNAYVTCQMPPPRKDLFSDIAEYFRRPRSPLAQQKGLDFGTVARISNGHSAKDNVNNGRLNSDDSLHCQVPSWRGEAPSPLSPHPSNTPSNAFLRFGDGPLNYGLTLPGRDDGRDGRPLKKSCLLSADILETRSCENLFSSNHAASSTPSSPCGGSLGSLEAMEEDSNEKGGTLENKDRTLNGLLLENAFKNSQILDMNYNPLIKSLLDSPCDEIQSVPDTTRKNESHNPDNIQSAPVSPRNDTDYGHKTRDLTLFKTFNTFSNNNDRREVNHNWSHSDGCGALANHQAKFLTLELLESKELAALDPDLKRSETEKIAGILNWNRPNERAFGLSTTLYERHPVTHERAGNPIADAFGVIARENNAILGLADGVNWGVEASLAARCAIHGCLSHINTALFAPGVPSPNSTTDLFVALLRSFHSAHSLILQEDGMLTTLTVAIVAPQINSSKYVVCVCNVGDSLAYVYSKKFGVREITQGSHDIYSMRDMRDALGALGPVDGQNPELNNLTCSMTFCDSGDIVFLTSDGISDNFDPVVGKFVLPKTENKERSSSRSSQSKSKSDAKEKHNKSSRRAHINLYNHNRAHRTVPRPRQSGRVQRQNSRNHSVSGGFKQPVSRSKSQPAVSETDALRHDPFLPFVEAHQRHELTLLRMEDLLRCGLTSSEPVTSAQELCFEMVHFATKLTVAKRRILEDPDLYPPAGAPQDLSRNDQRNRRRKVCEKLALVPGKLDHATVVAYTVGEFSMDNGTSSDSEDELLMLNRPLWHPYDSSERAPLASPDSARSILSGIDENRSRNSFSTGPNSWRNPCGTPTLASTEEFEDETKSKKLDTSFNVPPLSCEVDNKDRDEPSVTSCAYNNNEEGKCGTNGSFHLKQKSNLKFVESVV